MPDTVESGADPSNIQNGGRDTHKVMPGGLADSVDAGLAR
jgi:hypothetical protein